MAPDPLAQRAAQLANAATADYVGFRSAAIPFTDPMPALTTIGYSGDGRAMLLAGYGNDPDSALRALQLQWRTRKPDCSFTRFGTAVQHDETGFDVAAAVLIAPGATAP